MPKTKPQTKSEFIDRVAAKTGSSRKDAEAAVNAVLDTLQETLMQGLDQAFIGFGIFSVKARPEKTGRNPSTGASMVIKARRVPAFKPGLQLKEALNKK